MSIKEQLTTELGNIADAIRSKTGAEDALAVTEMASAIEGINESTYGMISSSGVIVIDEPNESGIYYASVTFEKPLELLTEMNKNGQITNSVLNEMCFTAMGRGKPNYNSTLDSAYWVDIMGKDMIALGGQNADYIFVQNTTTAWDRWNINGVVYDRTVYAKFSKTHAEFSIQFKNGNTIFTGQLPEYVKMIPYCFEFLNATVQDFIDQLQDAA